MLRFGPPTTESRKMEMEDIFFLRVKLMIVMAKSHLGNCPLGEHRCRAILENARQLESDSKKLVGSEHRCASSEILPQHRHIFFERVKLLTVMVKALVKGCPLGEHRRHAIEENLDAISRMLKFTDHTSAMAETMALFKVA